MVRGSVVECRVYPEVGPGEKAADVHFEYVQAAVFEAAALEEPRHHVMASDTRSGDGGASEPRSDLEDPPIYSDRPQCLCGPSEAYLAARPRLKNLVRAPPAARRCVRACLPS